MTNGFLDAAVQQYKQTSGMAGFILIGVKDVQLETDPVVGFLYGETAEVQLTVSGLTNEQVYGATVEVAAAHAPRTIFHETGAPEPIKKRKRRKVVKKAKKAVKR